MFKQKTVKVFSIVALVLSAMGLLVCILATLMLPKTGYTLGFLAGIVSWGILLWASIIGYQLSSAYKLYEDEYKKIGIRIYLIILAFFIFLFAGLVIGLALSVGLLAALWALKSNYDEWRFEDLSYLQEDAEVIEHPSAVDAKENE